MVAFVSFLYRVYGERELALSSTTAINNGSACSVLFLRTTGFFPARKEFLGYIESQPRLFQPLNLLISKNFKRYASLTFEQAQAEAADELR